MMAKPNYRQIYARKAECEKRIKGVCPDCPNTSGIYFILREEDGFRYGYIGKAKHLLERLGQHLIGYQHIDLSIKKHGLWSDENPTGYKIHFLQFPESELDEKERYFIQRYANAGWQMRNVESGGTNGKTDIADRRPARGYFDGKEAGYLMARREVAHWFSLHLNVSMKKQTKNAEKAYNKFMEFIDLEADDDKQ
jgi:hypothetical protein